MPNDLQKIFMNANMKGFTSQDSIQDEFIQAEYLKLTAANFKDEKPILTRIAQENSSQGSQYSYEDVPPSKNRRQPVLSRKQYDRPLTTYSFQKKPVHVLKEDSETILDFEDEYEKSASFSDFTSESDDENLADAYVGETDTFNEDELPASLLNLCSRAERHQKQIAAAQDSVYREKVAALQMPPGTKLQEHQIDGVAWMFKRVALGMNCLLADEMGTGKTLQTISLLRIMKHTHPDLLALVIAPNSTIANWEREAKFWAPELNTVIYHGSMEDRTHLRKHITKQIEKQKLNIIIAPYSLLSMRADKKFLVKNDYNFLICDEAQMVKNKSAQRFSQLLDIGNKSDHKILLSGTPVQNNLLELFSLLTFIIFNNRNSYELPQVLSDIESLVRKKYSSEELIAKVRSLLEPFMLRRTKNQVLSLPDKIKHEVLLDMDPEQKSLYEKNTGAHWVTRRKIANNLALVRTYYTDELCQEVVDFCFTNFKSPAERGQFFQQIRPFTYSSETDSTNLPTRISDLREVDEDFLYDVITCCTDYQLHMVIGALHMPDNYLLPMNKLMSPKIMKLVDIAKECVSRKEKFLIFSGWTSILDIIELVLMDQNIEFNRLDGQVDTVDRQDIIDEFNNDNNYSIPAMLITTRAGGVGINLVSAKTVIFHDVDINPTVDAQAEDRIHRIGQTSDVNIYSLVTKDSVDEGIYRISQKKMGLIGSILEDDLIKEIDEELAKL